MNAQLARIAAALARLTGLPLTRAAARERAARQLAERVQQRLDAIDRAARREP